MCKKICASGLRWLWISIGIIALDRFTKMWAVHHLIAFEPQHVLPIFNLTLVFNTGAAFSFLHQASGWQNLFLSSLAFIVSITILVWLSTLPRNARYVSVSLSLILGGALGNAWDRILYQHVIDFLDFHLGHWHFAIFNVADSAICIGTLLLLWHWFKPAPVHSSK